MTETEAGCLKSKIEKKYLGVPSKFFVSSIMITFLWAKNPTFIDVLPDVGLVSYDMVKVQINFISPSKDGSHFLRHHLPGSIGMGGVGYLFLIRVEVMA